MVLSNPSPTFYTNMDGLSNLLLATLHNWRPYFRSVQFVLYGGIQATGAILDVVRSHVMVGLSMRR